ncbi:MAG: hypothetical protein ACW7DW_18525, partial [Paraglaciecola chathamensis]
KIEEIYWLESKGSETMVFPELTLQEIRDATYKAWVLGENRFKQQIEEQTGRRVVPLARGGDRKSKSFKGII